MRYFQPQMSKAPARKRSTRTSPTSALMRDIEKHNPQLVSRVVLGKKAQLPSKLN